MNESLLPSNATSVERALAYATRYVGTVPVLVKETWNPLTCPVDFLPWLAWGLSVDDWDSTWPESTKRQAIIDSIEIHRHKGTLGALKRALQKLNYEVTVDENTGEAYTFRLIVNMVGRSTTDWTFSEAERVAIASKNVRSYLSGIRGLVLSDPALARIVSVELDGITTIVYPAS